MSHIIVWCRNHPFFVLFGILFISVFFLYQALTNIQLDASIDGMIIRNNQDYKDYVKTKKEFITDNISVVYIKNDNIFTNKILTAIDDVFYTIEETPGVVRVDSLFNTRNFNGSNGTLEIDPLIQYIPDDHEVEDLQKIKRNAVRSPLLARNLISRDGTVTVINVLAENLEDENKTEYCPQDHRSQYTHHWFEYHGCKSYRIRDINPQGVGNRRVSENHCNDIISS